MPSVFDRSSARRTVAVGAILAAAGSAHANVPVYTQFDLQARAAFGSGFNVPNSSSFSSVSPAVNPGRRVASKVIGVGGTLAQGVFLAQNGAGGMVFTSTVDEIVGDVSINAAGNVAFEVSFGSMNGVYVYDAAAGAASRLTTLPAGATSWAGPRINDQDQVAYRAAVPGGRVLVSYSGGSVAVHAAEAGVNAASPYSFLFNPAFNNARQIAAKVRYGAPGQTAESQPDEIRLFNADGSSTTIARDRDADPSSQYVSFDNGVGVNDLGQVAFVATLTDSSRAVVLSDGVTTTIIANNFVNTGNIESFPPSVNNRGWVAFRAFETSTLRAVWVGDGGFPRRVIGQFDSVTTDLGPATIARTDSSPVFGGSVWINCRGDVAFNASLLNGAGQSIGSGVFLALAPNPADWDGSGSVNSGDVSAYLASWFSDLASGTSTSEFDGQPGITSGDVSAFLSAWFQALAGGGAC